MSDGDDADHIDLQAVNQGIGKTVERQRSRVARDQFAQFGEPIQKAKRLIELVGEIIRCNECAFAYVPIDGSIGISLCLVAKTDQHRLWQH